MLPGQSNGVSVGIKCLTISRVLFLSIFSIYNELDQSIKPKKVKGHNALSVSASTVLGKVAVTVTAEPLE